MRSRAIILQTVPVIGAMKKRDDNDNNNNVAITGRKLLPKLPSPRCRHHHVAELRGRSEAL